MAPEREEAWRVFSENYGGVHAHAVEDFDHWWRTREIRGASGSTLVVNRYEFDLICEHGEPERVIVAE